MRTTLLTQMTIIASMLNLAPHAVAELRDVEFQGATLVYSDSGPADAETTPLVLVHGWAGAHTLWHHQIDAFSEERRVIALDLPGNGASEDVEAEHSMDLYADAIAAVMDSAGIDKAVLIGHSNGVPTIRQFIRRYPQRMVAFIGVDGALMNLMPPGMMDQFMPMLEGEGYKEFATQMFTGMLEPLKNLDDAALVQETMLATPQRVMVGGFRAGQDPAIWIDDRIGVPTLVINANSPWWTEDYNAYIETLSDDVVVETWEGVSHFLFMDDPERFNATVSAFLNDRDL